MRTWGVPTWRFLSVMDTRRIGCLIKVCQELKMPNFGYVLSGTVNF